MKIWTGLLIAMALPTAFALDISTVDGKVYHDVKLQDAGGEKIKVIHSDGEKTVKLEELKPFDVKTVDGTVLEKAQLSGINKDRIMIEQDGELRGIRFTQLAPEFRDAFGFSPSKNQQPVKAKTTAAPAIKTKPAANSGDAMYNQGKVFLEKLKQAPVNSPSNSSTYKITSGNIHKSIVFIRNAQGSGSGFICLLRGIPVIITNAHVYAAMPDTTIKDSDRHEYLPKSALVSKTRDLVILEIDLPPGVIPLELNSKVTDLALNSGLAAYGDSLGDGVVTDLKGNLLGTGPAVIEISAGIVPGNSGGPVVDAKLKVIGVSTYLQRSSLEQNIFDGTRFGNKDAKGEGVRRFATRVDNIELNDFEIFNLERQHKDLEVYNSILEANNSFLKNVRDYKNSFEVMMFFLKTYVPANIPWNYQSSLRFINNMVKTEAEKARFISVAMGIPMNNASEVERLQAQKLYDKMQPYRKSQHNCPRCRGTGQVTVRDYSNHNRISDFGKRTCDVCGGNPQRTFVMYNLYNNFLSGVVKTLPQEFSGLFPGCSEQTAASMLKSLGEPLKNEYCGVISFWQYKGNNLYPEAKATVLTFIADRLESVMILFDNSPAIWNRLQKQLLKKYGKASWNIDSGN